MAKKRITTHTDAFGHEQTAVREDGRFADKPAAGAAGRIDLGAEPTDGTASTARLEQERKAAGAWKYGGMVRRDGDDALVVLKNGERSKVVRMPYAEHKRAQQKLRDGIFMHFDTDAWPEHSTMDAETLPAPTWATPADAALSEAADELERAERAYARARRSEPPLSPKIKAAAERQKVAHQDHRDAHRAWVEDSRRRRAARDAAAERLSMETFADEVAAHRERAARWTDHRGVLGADAPEHLLEERLMLVEYAGRNGIFRSGADLPGAQ